MMDFETVKNLTELVKVVYPDLLQPAAKEVGSALEAVAKTGRLLLFPFQLLAVGQERAQRWLEAIREGVPPERQTPLPPEIGGPALMALPFATDGGILEALYLNLLNKAGDSENAEAAHPAFVHIISQLSPDEALLLMILRDNPSFGLKLIEKHPESVGKMQQRYEQTFSNAELAERLASPDDAEMYLEHFLTLNLLVWTRNYSKISRALEPDLDFYETTRPVDLGDGDLYYSPDYAWTTETTFSEFGNMFVRACVPNSYPPARTTPACA